MQGNDKVVQFPAIVIIARIIAGETLQKMQPLLNATEFKLQPCVETTRCRLTYTRQI